MRTVFTVDIYIHAWRTLRTVFSQRFFSAARVILLPLII